MFGIEKAVELLKEASKCVVYFDPDIDGLIAGYLACRFLDKLKKPYTYILNENRAHGFKTDPKKLTGYTVVAVDFAISPSEVDEIMNAGATLISLDHHTIGDAIERDRAIVINNQYSFEPEEKRFLSGAGVVYEAFCEIDSSFASEENKALVGISLLSDIRVIENDLARDYLKCTYTSRAPMIEYLVNCTKNARDFQFGNIRMDRNFIDYTFSPKINSLFRTNQGDLAVQMITGRPLSSQVLIHSKEYQDKMLNYIMDNLVGYEFSNLVCKGVENPPFELENGALLSNFIGLACSRVKAQGKTVHSSVIDGKIVEQSSQGKTAFLYVGDGTIVERGSVRGKLDNVDYLSLFRDFGFNADGHKNAFGVMQTDLLKIDLELLNCVITKVEQMAKGKSVNRVFDVVNLSTFKDAKSLAISNIYSRSCNMQYIRYVGRNAVLDKQGKLFLWHIDNIPVKCFSEEITPQNGVIVPLYDRGYLVFYLRQIE